MLASLASRRATKAATVNERIGILEKEVHDADERLRRLYKLVEDGVTEHDDILKDRLEALKADRDRAHTALERARAGARPAVDIGPALIERFGQSMRDKLTSGDVPFRKAYIGTIVDRIEVDDHQIRVLGRKDALEQAVLANGAPCQEFAVCSQMAHRAGFEPHDPHIGSLRAQRGRPQGQ
jgi:site-specific DNA recombinase